MEYQFLMVSPDSPHETAESEKPQRGRPTVRRNFLLGARNNWLSMLEENWAEIAFSLLELRRNEHSAIEDVQKAFKSLNGTDTDRFSRVFLQGLPQQVTGTELRVNRIANSKLHDKIHAMRSQRLVLLSSCAQADEALKQAVEDDRVVIQEQVRARNDTLLRYEGRLSRMERESKELEHKVRDQETYWYCSELLDFLCGKRRNAIKPLNLANALAGLPDMGWRSSNARCARMPRDSSVGLPYRVVELMRRMCRRRPKDSKDPPIEFFRIQILELPKKDGIRDVLGRKWRDLRLAIEDCWKEQHSDEFLPYAITSEFMRKNLRSKSSADQVLDASEMLFGTEHQF